MEYKISGRVIKGDGYGKKLGFPTINLDPKIKEFPPEGVYAGRVVLDGKEYRAGIVIGPGGKIEAHLIGYKGNAHGEKTIFEIKKFIRKFKKFKNEADLIKQIKKDIQVCSRA